MQLANDLPRSALRLLRSDARAWWYHKSLREHGNTSEARKRERASFRDNVARIREAKAKGGFLTIGRGGSTLYYTSNATVTGLHNGFREACRAVLPTIDTTTVPSDRIVTLAMSAPMATLASEPVAPFTEPRQRELFGVPIQWGALDRVPWPMLVPLYRAAGATLINA